MTVGSLLELYTTYYGWEFYTLIWSVLAGAGLVFVHNCWCDQLYHMEQ